MANLVDYDAIQTNTFIKIVVDEDVWLFSDKNESFTFDEDEYIATGNLMNLSSTSSELRVSSSEVNITVSGVPNTEISNVLDSALKGSSVKIYRGFFDISTGDLLELDVNPLLRYRGYINNYSISEDYDVSGRTGNSTIQFICASAVDQLQYKMAGRQTNPSSMKKFYPDDISMDRVPNLENATFNFGAP